MIPFLIAVVPHYKSDFLLACDSSELCWLGAAFRRLSIGEGFVLGDGAPVDSDSKCIIAVECATANTQPIFDQLDVAHYRWLVPPACALDYAELAESLARSPSGHQYLDSGNYPTIMLSLGEYDTEILRRIRDDGDPSVDVS